MADTRLNIDKPEHHVIFSDIRQNLLAMAVRGKNNKEHNRECCACQLACCARTGLAALAFLLILIFLGVTFLISLRSCLPEINICGLNFPTFEVIMHRKSATRHTASLIAQIELGIEFLNKNKKVDLSYGQLRILATAEDFHLGKAKVGAFSQKTRNSTFIRVGTRIEHVGIYKADAEQLKFDLVNSEVFLGVIIASTLSFHVGGITINGIPILARCYPKKAEIEIETKTICSVSIVPT
ncbi:hypothetical protein UlMin_012925 [Ulmus minor]